MRDFKVVIIGGGMMGVGLLYHLCLEGWTDVVLLEKGELTSGSTWHAAGQCPSFSGSYNLAKIHHYGNTLYPRLEAMTGQYTGWHGCGGIRVATTPEELDWFRHVAGFAPTIGFRMEIVDPVKMKEINPFLDTTGVLGGAWTLDDGHVDPTGCCNAMAQLARGLGGEIHRQTLVRGLRRAGDGRWIVETDQEEYSTEHVVNAAGCYAREVGLMAGVNVPITNLEHQYLVTETVPELAGWEHELPVMRDPYAAGYYRQEQKGGLIGIYEHSDAREAWAHRGGAPAWEASNELFDPDLERLNPWLERALERMPIFAKAGIKRVVNGAIPHTPDGMPLLGPAPGAPNMWLCCGSSIGIAQGAGCGKYLAQWMVHGAADINMREFAPSRFGDWAHQDYVRAKSFEDYQHMFVTHLPGEERPAGRPNRRSALYEKLCAKGAVHTEGAGWERPKWFSLDGTAETPGFRHDASFAVVADECRAVRERVGICDLSSFAKFDVTGPDATAALSRLLANRLPKREGGIGLAHRLTETGRIESEFSVTRFSDRHYYLVSALGAETADLDALQTLAASHDITVENMTDSHGVLVVAGPRSADVLSRLTEAPLESHSFPWLTGRVITLADHELRALRVTYVGERGWELHMPQHALCEVYDAIWAAGEDFGIADFGLYAVDSLRMEKAYRGWGAELTNEVNLAQADMRRFADLSRTDFVGAAATSAAFSSPDALRLIHIDVERSDATLRGGEPVFADGKAIGVVTSGAYGHATGRHLAFAYVTAEPPENMKVLSLERWLDAKLLWAPVYDPENLRLRS